MSSPIHGERRPLLEDEDDVCMYKPSPLPKLQITILPYINDFVKHLHLTDDPSYTGYYSGLVESVFSVSQLIAIYPLAILSDLIGYRPVVIAGTIGLTLSAIIFGTSQNFATMLVSRVLAGLSSGNVAVIPSILCQITDSTNQSFAFPLFGLFWPLGAIIGSAIGGMLADPARQYPDFFDNSFFRVYPYFLPCFVVSLITFFGSLLSYCCLKETLDKHKEREIRPSTKSLLQLPMIRLLCTSAFCLSFISTAFEIVFVLFCYTAIEDGGLALPISEIGFSLALSGLISALLQLCFMPYLLQNFDHGKLYVFCMGMWRFAFMTFPILHKIAQQGPKYASSWSRYVLWGAITVTLGLTKVGHLCYSVNTLLIKANVPSMAAIGTANGLHQFFICLARAVSPAFISSVFIFSTKKHLLDGYLWVLVMILLAFMTTFLSKRILRVDTTV